jgi:LysM repeat protein
MKKKGLSWGSVGVWLGLMLGLPGFLQQVRATVLPVDSVGMQVVKGQQFVVHQVQARETFFVLARQYQVPVKKIMAANPQVKASLKTGDLVYIPRAAKAKKAARVAVPTYKTDAQGNKVHRVSGKQTLYSISRQYKLATADLKRWNNLTSDQLQAGQLLIVGLAPKPVAQAPRPVVILKPAEASKPTPDPQVPVNRTPILLVSKKERQNLRLPYKLDSASMGKVVSQIRESGIAEVIQGPEVNKYLALHHSAPVGSYVTVINRMNGRSISVRVIGTLPDVGTNEKVIIKLSKRAQQRLVALDQRFLVDVVYTPQNQ